MSKRGGKQPSQTTLTTTTTTATTVDNQYQIPPIEGLQYHFQPSKYHAQYLNYLGHVEELAIKPSVSDERIWNTLTTTEKTELMKEVVRLTVLRAHSGISSLDNKTINEGVKEKVVFSDSNKYKISVK